MQVRLILCGSDFHVHFGVMPAPILLKRVPLKKREYNHKNNFPGINSPPGISLLLGPPIKSAILCSAKIFSASPVGRKRLNLFIKRRQQHCCLKVMGNRTSEANSNRYHPIRHDPTSQQPILQRFPDAWNI